MPAPNNQSSREEIRAPHHMTEAEFVASPFQRASRALSLTLRELGCDQTTWLAVAVTFAHHWQSLTDEDMRQMWQAVTQPDYVAHATREAEAYLKRKGTG